MTYKTYFKNGIWDILLCTCMGTAIATSVFGGFLIGEEQADAYVRTFVLVLVLEVLLFAAGYSKKTILRGLLLFLAGIVVFFVYAFARSGTSVFADDASNPFLYYILLFLSALGIFLISRKGAGAFILYAAGSILIGFIEYLYSTNRIACLLVYLIAGLAMILYRNYTDNVRQTKTRRFARGGIIVVSLCVCLLSAAIGAGAYYGIAARLDPPAVVIKIFTKHMSLEEIEQAGITDYETEQVYVAYSGTPQEEEETPEDSNQENVQQAQTQTRYEEQDDESVRVIRYPLAVPLWVLLVILVAAAVFVLYFLRWFLRRRWYKKLREKDAGQQVLCLYHFFLRDFGRMDIGKSIQETPSEYVRRAQPQLKFFKSEETDFEELTQIYICAGYGSELPDAAQLSKFHSFYAGFYAQCRRYIGNVRYLFKLFRL